MSDLQREAKLTAMRARAQTQREQEAEHERVTRIAEMRLQAREIEL